MSGAPDKDKIPEIEITREMIAAGVEELRDYDPTASSRAEGAVVDIFVAMLAKSRQEFLARILVDQNNL